MSKTINTRLYTRLIPIFILLLLLLHDRLPLRAGEQSVDFNGAQLLETYSNGARKYRLKDGSEAILWNEGAMRVAHPDGTVIQTWPAEGVNSEVRRISFPDGSVESFFANGGVKTVRKDGTVIMTWPDGHLREVRPDGSVWATSATHRSFVNPDIIALENYPDRVEPGGQVTFRWQLNYGYADPWASILLPDGTIRTINAEDVRRDNGHFSIDVKFDAGQGRYKVEIIAVGKYGNEIAANFPVYAGEAAPRAVTPKMYPVADPKTPLDVLEVRFWDMVNQARRDVGVAALPWDIEVAQLARNHARDMAENGYFGHISPTHGNLARRAIKIFGWQTTIWGIPPGPPRPDTPNYIADDLSRAFSLADALESLMESPAHRRVLVCPHFTSGGVGMSWGDWSGEKTLFIVTAMLQKNRPTQAPKPRPKIRIKTDGGGFHIFGRDNEPDERIR